MSFLLRDPSLTMRNAPTNRKRGSSEAQAPTDNQRPNSRLRDGTGLCLSVYLSASVPPPNPKQPSQAPGPSCDQCCLGPTYIFPICRPSHPSPPPSKPLSPRPAQVICSESWSTLQHSLQHSQRLTIISNRCLCVSLFSVGLPHEVDE